MMIRITPRISIDESEIHEKFVHAHGPGGQNVNKVSSAVELHFDIANSSLPVEVRPRLIKLGGKRVSTEGVLVIEARRFRTQPQNREDARARLITLIRQAARALKPRRKTKPTRTAYEKRIRVKKIHGEIKKMRGVVRTFD